MGNDRDKHLGTFELIITISKHTEEKPSSGNERKLGTSAVLNESNAGKLGKQSSFLLAKKNIRVRIGLIVFHPL